MNKFPFILPLAFLMSCQHEAVKVDIPPCDSTVVTYSKTIKPMLEQKCYACHSGATLSGGVDLGPYNNVKFYADEGSLWSVSVRNGQFPPMPIDSTDRVDDCELGQLKKWIREGALDN